MLLYYFYQSILAVVIYILWILIAPVPDHIGAATPIMVVVMSAAQFVLGTLLLFMLKPENRKKPFLALGIYTLCYLLVYAGLFNRLIVNISADSYLGIIHRGYALSGILAGVLCYFYYRWSQTSRQ